MASLRNAVKRRAHSERRQPAKRQKRFGMLEHKKDYVARAKVFNERRDKVKGLQRAAEERNPDEFYFAMENSAVRGGRHVSTRSDDKGNQFHGISESKLKAADLGYVQKKRSEEAARVAKLQASLHLFGADHALPVEARPQPSIRPGRVGEDGRALALAVDVGELARVLAAEREADGETLAEATVRRRKERKARLNMLADSQRKDRRERSAAFVGYGAGWGDLAVGGDQSFDDVMGANEMSRKEAKRLRWKENRRRKKDKAEGGDGGEDGDSAEQQTRRRRRRRKKVRVKPEDRLAAVDAAKAVAEEDRELSHVVFVDSDEDAADFDAAEFFDTAPELVGRAFNRPRLSTLRAEQVAVATPKIQRARRNAYRELSQRMDRLGKLSDIATKLGVQKKVMQKGRKRLVKDGTSTKAPIYKWKRERAR